jgi:predicted site-specific integrase-resolvase
VQGWVIAKEITEIGSGLNGKRKKLLILKVLQDETLNLEQSSLSICSFSLNESPLL